MRGHVVWDPPWYGLHSGIHFHKHVQTYGKLMVFTLTRSHILVKVSSQINTNPGLTFNTMSYFVIMQTLGVTRLRPY